MTRTSPTARALTALLALLTLLALAGCGEVADAVEESIDGEAAALKEADLPNCSRVINCCANLKTRDFTPQDVNDACDDTFVPASDTIIDTYKTARAQIDPNLTNADAVKEELKVAYQEAVEPGCRCFLEETVGQAGNFALPKDCEIVEETGQLEPPAMCSDATDAMLEAVTNPPTVEDN